jgi:hypothetical protein
MGKEKPMNTNTLPSAVDQMVLFADGTYSKHVVKQYHGACLAGQATAYVVKNGQTIWVSPGRYFPWYENPDK